jgi:molecular chaperone GrpE
MADKHRDDQDREPEEPAIQDKRKIDPETGEPRAEAPAADRAPDEDDGLSDEDLALLADAEKDLVAEYREIAARAQADLKNFRTRVERDRAANREAVIAEVIRSFLPVIDDLDRADAHGDLVEGAPSSRRSCVRGSRSTACAASARSARCSTRTSTRRSCTCPTRMPRVRP